MPPGRNFNFSSLPPLGLYIHLPWCVRKCPYCDFNSHELREALPEARYIDALLEDLEQELPRVWGRRIESVFIGGGTPSLFSAAAVERLLGGLRARIPMRPALEVTLEANPGAAERGRFDELRGAGISRLSIGVQSFDDQCLERLGRIHNAQEAIRALDAAHAAGFENINIDLMFGLPGQHLDGGMKDLRTALALAPTHVSFYQLTIEPNTLFHYQPPALPDEDLTWEMQIQGQGLLAEHGYTQYEVSAYAKSNRRCEHNMNYWQFGDYLGIGAGAHGKCTCAATQSIHRYWKHRQPRHYMACVGAGRAIAGDRSLDAQEATFEFMLNALRLTAGFDVALFSERTGLPERALEPQVTELVDRELLWRRDGRIGATSSLGQRFLDDVVSNFLPCDERAH
jgi:oxygen-independent coproporphyrinogen-3 oxidase